MFNNINSTNIDKANNHISSQIIEHKKKKRLRHMTLDEETPLQVTCQRSYVLWKCHWGD